MYGKDLRPVQGKFFVTFQEVTSRQQVDQDTPIRSGTSRGTSGLSAVSTTNDGGSGSGNAPLIDAADTQLN